MVYSLHGRVFFHFFDSVQNSSGFCEFSSQVGAGTIVTGVRQPKLESDPSHVCGNEVRNALNYTRHCSTFLHKVVVSDVCEKFNID